MVRTSATSQRQAYRHRYPGDDRGARETGHGEGLRCINLPGISGRAEGGAGSVANPPAWVGRAGMKMTRDQTRPYARLRLDDFEAGISDLNAATFCVWRGGPPQRGGNNGIIHWRRLWADAGGNFSLEFAPLRDRPCDSPAKPAGNLDLVKERGSKIVDPSVSSRTVEPSVSAILGLCWLPRTPSETRVCVTACVTVAAQRRPAGATTPVCRHNHPGLPAQPPRSAGATTPVCRRNHPGLPAQPPRSAGATTPVCRRNHPGLPAQPSPATSLGCSRKFLLLRYFYAGQGILSISIRSRRIS